MCGKIFNNQLIAKNVPIKNFENRLIFDKDMNNHKVGRFFRHSVLLLPSHLMNI